MKNQMMAIGAALLFSFGNATFIGCGGEKHHKTNDHQQHEQTEVKEEQHHDHDDAQHVHYQCPMDCEKGKIYEAPGQCPVCGMDLEKVSKED